MKIKVKGFTLVEIIIIVIILGIIMAVTVPSVIGYIDRTDERECNAATSMLESAAAAELKITPTLKDAVIADPTCVFSAIESGEKMRTTACPCGGEYKAKYDSVNKKIVITCSYHDAGNIVSSYQSVINTIRNDYMKTHSYLSGQKLNELLKEQYGGSLPTTEIDGKSYFIKGNTAVGTTSPVLYLSTNSSTNSWYGFYFYDSENDQWYISARVHPYNKRPEEVCITSKDAFEKAIANGQLVPTDKVM